MNFFKKPLTITFFSLLFLLFLITPLITSAVSVGGGIGILPSTQDPNDPRTKSWFIYTMNSGETKEDSVVIINNSEDEVVVKVYPVDAITTTDGNFALVDEYAEQTGIGDWVELFAYEVGLKPNEVKKIPFTITLPENVEVGDHMGGIIIQEISRGPAGIAKEGMTMSIITRVGVRIYLTVPGERIDKLNIENFEYFFVSQPAGFIKTFLKLNYLTQFILDLKNEGNTRIEPDVKIKIKNIFGKTIEEIGGELGMVFPKKSTNIFLKWEKPLFFGRYTAEATVTYSDTQEPAVEKIVFWAIPYKVLIVLGSLIILGVLLRLILLYFIELSKEKMLIYSLSNKETIQEVAEKFKVNWSKLARINNIKKPYTIKKGQKLFIPFNRRNRELLAVLLKKGIMAPSIQEKLGKSNKSFLEKIHQGKRSLKILLIAAFVIVIGGGLMLLFLVNSKKQNIVQTAVQIATPDGAVDETRTKSGELKRSEIKLAVHNNSSSSENIEKLLKKLEFVGFQVEKTSDRSQQSYEKTTFEYQKGKLEQARAVQTALELNDEDVEFLEVDDLDFNVVIAYFVGDIFDLKIPELTDEDLQLLEKVDGGEIGQENQESSINKEDVSLSVLNGGAPSGTAGQVANALIQSGFTEATAENADNFDYQGITIYYQSDYSSAAVEIKNILSEDYSNINLEESSDIPTNIQVLLGS
jgi:flagellar basal body-associated protein FliL